MASELLYSSEYLDVRADYGRKQLYIDTASSGYQPKYVTVVIDNIRDLDQLIETLQAARANMA